MSKTVIVIDDNEDDLLFAQISVQRCGHPADIKQFFRAQDALAFLASGELVEPALVLLDINMPVMNGFDFLDAYEQLPIASRANVMVVMLTSSIDQRDRQRAFFYASVKDYLRKPIERSQVANLLQRLDTLGS
ncbi:response regulator [Hydrogenophaga sp.]|uniref:response regulator n=1 Tax=Hydrogenophaga sp. TaxID=1904254 RepID=UPI0025BE6D47|nr:response regulator [Hydrogenophaga sp.]